MNVESAVINKTKQILLLLRLLRILVIPRSREMPRMGLVVVFSSLILTSLWRSLPA